LRDVRAPHGRPAIPLEAQGIDDACDLLQRHTIHCLRGDAGRHRSLVAVNLPIRREVELRVVQLPVEVIDRPSSFAACPDDSPTRFGVPPRAYLTFSGYPRHLPSFAMWTAFPSADYYEGSVVVGLAPRRRSRVP